MPMRDLLERTRVATHIRRAEARLRARRVPGDAREALAEYRRRGRFPINRTDRACTPVFVDEAGTHCAVAHLIDRAGDPALVARVAATDNLAAIRDLPQPPLVAFARAHGLTVDDLAWIQPSYMTYVDATPEQSAALAEMLLQMGRIAWLWIGVIGWLALGCLASGLRMIRGLRVPPGLGAAPLIAAVVLLLGSMEHTGVGALIFEALDGPQFEMGIRYGTAISYARDLVMQQHELHGQWHLLLAAMAVAVALRLALLTCRRGCDACGETTTTTTLTAPFGGCGHCGERRGLVARLRAFDWRTRVALVSLVLVAFWLASAPGRHLLSQLT